MENDIIKYYDYTEIFNTDTRLQIINDIDKLILDGIYLKTSHLYQTPAEWNIFDLFNGKHWLDLKQTFLISCKNFYGKDFDIKSIKSWGYKKNIDTETPNKELIWHQHSGTITGIFYLNIPDDEEESGYGTEFAPEAKNVDECEKCLNRFKAKIKLDHWLIWNSSLWHTPPIVKSKSWRYIIAADLEIAKKIDTNA